MYAHTLLAIPDRRLDAPDLMSGTHGNGEYFSLHYDRESCSLKAVWDGEESTRVHKSPGSEITSSFASWPVICVPDMRSGASSRRSG